MTADPGAARARPPSTLDLGAPALLFTPLAGTLAVVAAIWVLVSAPGTLALIFAILVALAGTSAIIAVVNHELRDSDGFGGAAESREQEGAAS